jgi:glycosyltransferase involved in cell wall biosynthesis
MNTLVTALAALRPEFPTVRLLLYGRAEVGAEDEAKFERLMEHLGVSDSVVRMGLISEERLQDLYRECTLFVLPSLYEGFGLPLIEAMASGACVVAHNGSAMSEVVGDAGCLTDASRSDSLAATITALLRDPAYRDSIARKGVVHSRKYNLESMAEATFKIYSDAMP